MNMFGPNMKQVTVLYVYIYIYIYIQQNSTYPDAGYPDRQLSG